ncbi:MAG TPA: FAD-linked oxidase C-terminal domain-containing protein [Acidimicrobiales bacterium]|jgi:glycolate oxidase|nr:FAD-linked oxidase C-terminal domain-containing protein [Acidimicrobiales bacterium]
MSVDEGARCQVIDPGLVERLRGISGGEHVLTDTHELRTYESDGLRHYRSPPPVAVLAGSADEVRDIVRACHEARTPWVARGAGTGLSGGALPIEDGVLIVLTRLNRILEVDLDNQRVVVEPCVTNAAVSKAVGPAHFYPPDPSSQVVSTIGGNVAENSGGLHCFKYGFTTNYVTGLRVVLPDAEVVTLGGKELDRPGYDLIGAFVGSEGTLGIATEITLRVIPLAESHETTVAYFDGIEQAGQAVSDIVARGIVPAAIEIMDKLTIEATENWTHAGYPLDVGAALIVELDGPQAECDARSGDVLEIFEKAGASGTRVAGNEEERALIWKARKAAFGAMGYLSPYYYVQDSVIPRTRLAEILGRIGELSEEYGLRIANVFHAGDGNLHPLVCFDARNPGESERAEEVAGLILTACVEAGGSITGEHGVGVDKKKHMTEMFSEQDLDAFQRLRCAFDPDQRANPGKVMPTPRLCGEVPGPYRKHPLEQAGVAERF